MPWWLLRDGEVLASAEVATTLAQRSRGLLGRDGYEGAFIMPHTRAIHSIGMRFALDVAFLDGELKVLDTARVPPWRMSLPRHHGRVVLEAEAGAFERWRLKAGDRLELRQSR